MSGVIWAGSNPQEFNRDIVGGKGLYLLRLFNLAQQTGMFEVTNFFIIPTNAKRRYRNTNDGTSAVYEGREIEDAFERLRKPAALRSSSPLEDGVNASFAGMFGSFLNVNNYNEACFRAYDIYESAFWEIVQTYAYRMGVNFSSEMALIVQEEVTDALVRGTIQLEEHKAVIDAFDREGRIHSLETEYKFLDELFPGGFKWEMKPESEPRDWIGKGEFDYAMYCAREASKRLGLDGIVQVEFLLSPSKLPRFVQIRQLPNVKSYAAQLDMDIPKGVPYVESQVCNDVAGELVLPAYVTTSQSGLPGILIETGQKSFISLGNSDDERAERFNQHSKLAQNHDFRQFTDLAIYERVFGVKGVLPLYNAAWSTGNALFGSYILVCDKLDEKIAEMAYVTTNKKAIITCNEATKTSHAMTVARDLGIMCMGVQGDLHDLKPEFFHLIETGDIIHMKSDGRRAVAYLEKKRIADPYQK